jgi:hypothetical protein
MPWQQLAYRLVRAPQLSDAGSQSDLPFSFTLNGHPCRRLRGNDYLLRGYDEAGNLYGVIEGVLRAETNDGGVREILRHFEQGNLIGFHPPNASTVLGLGHNARQASLLSR